MTKKLSKNARTARIENTCKLLKKHLPSLSENNCVKIGTEIESTAFENLIDNNNVHIYRQQIINSVYEHFVKEHVPIYTQHYLKLPEVINPLELDEHDEKLKQLLPLKQEDLNSITPSINNTKLTDDQLGKLIGVPVSDWRALANCSRCKGPGELKESRQDRSADEGQTLYFYCKKCNINWRTN